MEFEDVYIEEVVLLIRVTAVYQKAVIHCYLDMGTVQGLDAFPSRFALRPFISSDLLFSEAFVSH